MSLSDKLQIIGKDYTVEQRDDCSACLWLIYFWPEMNFVWEELQNRTCPLCVRIGMYFCYRKNDDKSVFIPQSDLTNTNVGYVLWANISFLRGPLCKLYC